jgi:hypothetical protein
MRWDFGSSGGTVKMICRPGKVSEKRLTLLLARCPCLAYAHELVTVIKGNVSVDWMHRDSARANIRRHVKRLLRK